jgi:hypothetical protein
MSPVRRPDLYYDPTRNLAYSLGGRAYQLNGGPINISIPVQLWGFKPDGGYVNWELQETGPTQDFPLTGVVEYSLTATSPTGHYSLGGYVELQQETITLDSMVDIDFANQSWSNQTLSGQSFFYGEAQYVPTFGQEGVVLFFGGYGSLSGLDTIMVYDIHSNMFFEQPATNAPISRTTFCSVGAGMTGSAHSSYEMYVSPTSPSRCIA